MGCKICEDLRKELRANNNAIRRVARHFESKVCESCVAKDEEIRRLKIKLEDARQYEKIYNEACAYFDSRVRFSINKPLKERIEEFLNRPKEKREADVRD